MNAPRIYAAEQVSAVLAELDTPAVVESAFVEHARGGSRLPAESCLRWGENARSIAMHAYLAGPPPRAGMKLINAAIENPSRGLPRASGIIALFDPVTARIRGLMPAAEISALRTAAVSCLAARHLAGPGAVRLALLGAGALATAHAQLLIGELAISELRVHDLDLERAESLAALCPIDAVEVATDAESTVCNADVIVAATTTTTPYVKLDWLAPGSLFLNVSLDDLCAEVFTGAERVFVDDWRLILADDQRLLGKLARAGEILGPGIASSTGKAISGELPALFAGAIGGRESEGERIVVNPFGMAISDIAIASAVAEAIDSKEIQ